MDPSSVGLPFIFSQPLPNELIGVMIPPPLFPFFPLFPLFSNDLTFLIVDLIRKTKKGKKLTDDSN
jgi:hypothetical protein